MPNFPSPEQVAVAWIKTLDDVDPTKVASTLPRDTATWATTGFVQVTSVGGSPSTDSPLYAPVLQVDAWAVSPSSAKSPWGQAGSIAGAVLLGTFDKAKHGAVTLPTEFHGAAVNSVVALSEPRRIPSDEAGYARYQFDIKLNWRLVLA